MDNDGGLLSAILAHPEDESLRLVYADWLEDHDDPRAEFLRLHLQWEQSWEGGEEPPASLTSRLEELQAAIDPGWVAVMKTLAVRREPFSFGYEVADLPVTESFCIRPVTGKYGQPGGLVTFASQIQLTEPPDAGLSEDLRLLADLCFGLGECYYGASDFPIYPFLAELPTSSEDPTTNEILAALKTRGFQDEGSGPFRHDTISNDFRQQHFFRHTQRADQENSPHGFLLRHIAPARLWYVLLRTRQEENTRDAIHFAVGRSPRGSHLLGVIAGGFWG